MSTRLEKIEAQPLNKILGVTRMSSHEGRGEILAVVNKVTVNPSGFYHAGAIYVLCDVCAMVGLSSLLEEEKEAVTHDLHVSVLRPSRENDEVAFRSRVTKLGKRLAFMEVEATVKEEVIATARVTKSILSFR